MGSKEMTPLLIFLALVSIASACIISDDIFEPGILVDFEEDGREIADTVCLPMRSADIRGSIVDGVVEVTLTQEFETYVCPTCFWPILERTQGHYQLPLDEKAAVTAFRAELGDRVIQGIVKDKEEAEKEYNEAIEAGEPAALAEQTRPDIFKISFGNMPPNVIVRVILVYVSPLEVFNSNIYRFVLPTNIAPRYHPRDEDEPIPELQPLLNDGVRISLGVVSSTDLEITSSTHALQARKVTNTVEIVEVVDSDPLKRDVVIDLKSASLPDDPQIFIEESSNGTYAMLMSWVPQLTQIESDNGPKEFIFVLDRSGSMRSDGKMTQLQAAMRIILDDLPSNSLFNFVGFGSSFESLFPEGSERVSNERAFNSAVSYIDSLAADYGSTEILLPIKAVLNSEAFPTYQRIVFLITDGQVSNEDEVIEFVGDNLGSSRVFTLGIGPSVGRTLLNGVARNGAGTSDFVDGDSDEAIVDAVTRQMATAYNTNSLTIRSVVFDNMLITQAPYQSPIFFAGRRILMYFLTDIDDSDGRTPPSEVSINVVDTVNATFMLNYQISSSDFIQTSSIFDSDVIHKIGAREMIRDLEEGRSSLHDDGNKPSEEELKEKITDIGVKYQITSSETSFVATDNKGWTAVIKEVENDSSTPLSFSPIAMKPPSAGVFGICFSPQNVVITRDKGPISMKNLRIGDMVYIGFGKFSPVYSFGHRDEDQLATYLQLYISNGDDPLEISHDHMLYVDKQGQIPASNVLIGDHVVLGNGEKVSVSKISTVNRVGVYAPFTKSGTVVVSNVLASSYISFPEINQVFAVGGSWKIFSMQWLAHAFQAPHRLFCDINTAACEREAYTTKGISTWVYGPLQFTKWIAGRGYVMMSMLLIPIIFAAIIFHGIEKCLLVCSSLNYLILVITAILIFFAQMKGTNKSMKSKIM